MPQPLLSSLPEEERAILKSLLKRKFDFKLSSWEDPYLLDRLNKKLHNLKKKRLEENYKLVFKRGLKFMLNRFKASKGSKLKKAEYER